MVDSELGQIPQGWEVKKLGDVCETSDYVAYGSFASLKANVRYLDDPGYAVLVRTKDFNGSWNGDYVWVDEESYRFLSKSSVSVGDIVVSNVGTIGVVFRVPDLGKPMTLGPNSVLVKPSTGKPFLFHFLKGSLGQHLISGITSGMSQPKFNKTEFRRMPVMWPTLDVITEFDSIEQSIATNSEALRKQN